MLFTRGGYVFDVGAAVPDGVVVRPISNLSSGT